MIYLGGESSVCVSTPISLFRSKCNNSVWAKVLFVCSNKRINHRREGKIRNEARTKAERRKEKERYVRRTVGGTHKEGRGKKKVVKMIITCSQNKKSKHQSGILLQLYRPPSTINYLRGEEEEEEGKQRGR